MTQVHPFGQCKATQREGWSLLAPVEAGTTIPAGELAGEYRRDNQMRQVFLMSRALKRA